MPTGVRHDLVIEQGSFFSEQFLYTDDDDGAISTLGATAIWQIRSRAGGLLYKGYTENAALPLTGVVIMGGANGIVELQMSSDETETLSFSRARYDLFITPVSLAKPVRLAYGIVKLLRAVSLAVSTPLASEEYGGY